MGKVQKQVKLLIIKENDAAPLLGRDIMEMLGITVTINKILKDSDSETLRKLLVKYETLFEDKLGRFKYEKIRLTIVKDAIPKYLKPRPLPFTYKSKVSEELERLEREGVITPINSSEWGTPLVPVLKADGSIRFCANLYKAILKHQFQEKISKKL